MPRCLLYDSRYATSLESGRDSCATSYDCAEIRYELEVYCFSNDVDPSEVTRLYATVVLE